MTHAEMLAMAEMNRQGAADMAARQCAKDTRRDGIIERRRQFEDAKADLVAMLKYGQCLVSKLDIAIDNTFDEYDELEGRI